MNLRILALAALAALGLGALAPTARAAPPATVLRVENELPPSYRPTHMILYVDGTVRYSGLPFRQTYLPPGDHVIELVASYRMHGTVLTYMNGYTIQIASSHVVRPPPNRSRVVDAFVVPNGGATTPLDRSAVIDWADR